MRGNEIHHDGAESKCDHQLPESVPDDAFKSAPEVYQIKFGAGGKGDVCKGEIIDKQEVGYGFFWYESQKIRPGDHACHDKARDERQLDLLEKP